MIKKKKCPLCKKWWQFAYWDEEWWWLPHICLQDKSVFFIPRKAA